ncbi:MAG: hypothetical protein E7049_06425 [Lentisphaerae bacterium]|nr:hypothetical protein [Lentisphaerota bacterium]
MAIDLNINKLGGKGTVVDTSVASDNFDVKQDKASGPILKGDSVTITSGAMSDLEKLVARLKNETSDMRQSMAQRRISIMQTVIDSMNIKVTEAQMNSLVDLEALGAEKSELEKELLSLNSEKTALEGRITLLDMQIEALEKQIAQAVEDGADHREQVAKLKEQRSREQADLDRLEGSISSISARISEIDVKISDCTSSIGATTLAAVTKALRDAAGVVGSSDTELKETNSDRVEAEKKALATDVARGISESLDKIDEEITKAIDEAQMKVEG